MTQPPRRRRRTGSTARRYRPSQLVQVSAQPRVSRETILTGVAVAIVAAALTALIWLMAFHSADDHRALQREEVERNLLAQASTLAEKVRLELLVVDQSLSVLQELWNQSPDNFKLTDWSKRLPALTAVSDDVFIADQLRVIQQDILPQAVGQGIGGAYLPFAHGSLELFTADGEKLRDSRIVTPTANQSIDARRYLMYVVRPLGDPPRLILGASYRSGEITRHFGDGALGTNGIVALIEQNQGMLQAIAGPAARRPRTNLTRTDMYEAMKKGDGGFWVGATGIDGTVRMHGWARVPGRASIVVVGTPINRAMATAELQAEATYSIAGMATGVVIAVGILITWGVATLRANRRRQRSYERAQSDLASAQSEVAQHRLRTATATTQLRSLLDGVTEAAAIFDADMKLVVWNDRFRAMAGLPDEAIQEGLPLDELIRRQCQAGLFGTHDDPEAEIARRTQALLTADSETRLTQQGPQGTPIPILARRMPDTGLVVIWAGLAEWQPPPRPAEPPPPPPQAEPAPETTGTGSTVEW